jgi:hypothetical protein
MRTDVAAPGRYAPPCPHAPPSAEYFDFILNAHKRLLQAHTEQIDTLNCRIDMLLDRLEEAGVLS